VQWCWQHFSSHYQNFQALHVQGFSGGSTLKSISFTHLRTYSTKPARRNKKFRKPYYQNQWDLGSMVSPEKWASGYRYFCKITARGPPVPLNHTICKCIKNTQKETVLNTLTAWLPAGLVHVNTAPFNTIFRKTMQQKTSSKQSPPKCFQA